ncbi:MAG: rod shape-determining protein MreC [Muribaculaceae bacterium]
MKELLNFLIKHSQWLVFIFYVFISCYLLFHNNPYQQHVYLTSANAVSASVYQGMSTVTSYFNLRDINEDLQERNALLEMEVINLRNQVNNLQLLSDSTAMPSNINQYEFITARVISNSISSAQNYITINRGESDGLRPEMGIVNQNGIVGTVDVVGKHFSRVISLLNSNFRLSCKVKGSDSFGSLVWDGKSPYHAVLEEMPRHVKYHRGDTIVTSGYSSVFPEGIIVGTIESDKKEVSDNFISLRIKLTTDFTQLSTVRAIKSDIKAEIDALDINNDQREEDSK